MTQKIDMKESIENINQAAKAIGVAFQIMAKNMTEFAKNISRCFGNYGRTEYPRIYHLSMYSKKKRIRKKNHRRLWQLIAKDATRSEGET